MTLRTLDIARVARRQARPRPLRPERPARRTARSPTTAASARRCRRSTRLLDAGAPVIVVSHLGRPDGEPDPRYSLAPGRQRCRAARRAGRVRAATGRRRRTDRRAREDGDVALLENLRFDPRETVEGRGRAAGVRRGARRSSATRSSPTASASCTASRRACTSSPQLLPSAAGLLIAAELDVLERLTENPGEAVHGRARRVEGQRQARRHRRTCCRGSTAADRRRDAVHLPRRAGPPGRQEPARGGPARHGAGLPRARPRSAACEIVAADRRRRRHRIRRRRRARSRVRADAIEDTPFGDDGLGLDIGPDTAGSFAERDPRVAAPCSGTARWACSSSRPFAAGTKAVAEALTEVDGLGVVGGGDSAAAVRALGFTDDQFGHISTGGGASLEFLEGKQLPGLEVLGWQRSHDAAAPLIAGNWKMNLDHLQSIAFVQKLAWTLKDARHDFGAVEVAVFPPFTDLRSVQTLIDADSCRSSSAARTCRARRRRVHRRDLGRVPEGARRART